MDEDEFDFSDSDLDDLPANTLQHLEANAIRATQQQALVAPESDYGLEDGDEVVNLDDDDGPSHAYSVAAPQCSQPQPQPEDEDEDVDHGGRELYEDQMDVEEQPRKSQVDPSQLLSRIKKVGYGASTRSRGAADVCSWSTTRHVSARPPTT
jgi:hypothetical protein